MRKVIIFMVLFILMPITGTFAADVDLLSGKLMNVSVVDAPVGGAVRTTSYLSTDNNSNTGTTIKDKEILWYDFGKPQNVTSMFLERWSNTDYSTVVTFYDADLSVIYINQPTIMGTTTFASTIQSVKYVGIHSTRGSGLDFNVDIFRIYGSESL